MAKFNQIKTGRQFRVESYQPWRYWLLRLGLLVLLLLCAAMGYVLGRYHTGHLVREHERTAVAASEEISRLQARNAQLIEQVSTAELTVAHECAGRDALAEDLANQQNKTGELEQELAFYRAFSELELDAQGLAVRAAQVAKKAPDNYTVTLPLLYAGSKALDGTLDLRVSGQLGEKSVTYAFADVDPERRLVLPFSVQQQQQLSWQMKFKEGLRPEKLTVVLEFSDKYRDKIVKIFDWQTIYSSKE